MEESIREQRAVCERVGASWVASPDSLKVGLSRNVRDGVMPINGLRHPPQGDTCGWYIWAGEELSTASDFFEPVHVAHLSAICPVVLKYLGLPPGWRFLVAGEYEHLWTDAELLNV